MGYHEEDRVCLCLHGLLFYVDPHDEDHHVVDHVDVREDGVEDGVEDDEVGPQEHLEFYKYR